MAVPSCAVFSVIVASAGWWIVCASVLVQDVLPERTFDGIGGADDVAALRTGPGYVWSVAYMLRFDMPSLASWRPCLPTRALFLSSHRSVQSV